MPQLTIKTNNIPRPTLDWHELTNSEQIELDYIDRPEITGSQFARYKGQIYDIHEFMPTNELLCGHEISPIKNWEGYQSDSYFSGVLISFVDDDCDFLVFGRYYC
jgi:hypothetical protein